jgi:serine/threonine-protein kinase
MSPEQMQSAKFADAQSDIWALGVILYELLLGRVPFGGEAITEVVVNVTTKAPLPLRGYRPDVPPGVEAVVLRCLEKDRQRRYRNVAELAVALVEFAPMRARALVERIAGTIQAAGLSARALDLPPSPKAGGTVLTPGVEARAGTAVPVSSTKSSLSMASSGTRATVAITLLGVAIVGGAGVWVARSTGHRRTPSPDVASASGPTLSTAAEAPADTAPSNAALSPTIAPSDSTTQVLVEAGQAASSPKRVPTRGSPTPTAPTGAATTPTPTPTSTTTRQGEGSSPNCNPPYTVDSAGIHHYKRECN